jgi:hypothetical protein
LYFNFFNIQGHPTFDGIAVRFEANRPIEAVFFNATAGSKHTCSIPREFIEYMDLFKRQSVFCLAYVLTEKTFKEFTLGSSSSVSKSVLDRLAFYKIMIKNEDISYAIQSA